jgi:molybdate-binding protein
VRAQGIRACEEWLDPREDRVISFVTREMGLMVKRGNPLIAQGYRRPQGALRQPRP